MSYSIYVTARVRSGTPCVYVCRISLPCAPEESEQRTRLHRKQRITVIPPSVILLFVVPLFILLFADEGYARQRSVPQLVILLASIHLPRAEREPSKLSPGRMLLHIQKTEGVREERGRGVERETERERKRERERRIGTEGGRVAFLCLLLLT